MILILAWTGIAIYGDTHFKAASSLLSGKFWLGFFYYSSTSFIAYWSYKLQQWGWITIMWTAANLAISLFLSVSLYNEPFTIKRKIASALVLLATILMVE